MCGGKNTEMKRNEKNTPIIKNENKSHAVQIYAVYMCVVYDELGMTRLQ